MPGAAEEVREVVPAVAPEQLDASVLPKTPGDTSAKTPSLASARRSGAACRGRPRPRGQLGDGPRPIGERVGDPEVDGDRERPRGERAAKQIPEAASGELIRGRGPRRRDLVHLGVGHRAAVEQAAAVADDGDDRRLARAQRRGELLLDGAGEARQLGQRQRAAADAGDRLLDRAADEHGEPLGPRAHHLGRLASIRSTGTSRRARSGSR